jgi:hypothetical protein
MEHLAFEDPRAFLDMNCGHCGRTLRIRLADVDSTARFIACEQCAKRQRDKTRPVLIAFDMTRGDCSKV